MQVSGEMGPPSTQSSCTCADAVRLSFKLQQESKSAVISADDWSKCKEEKAHWADSAGEGCEGIALWDGASALDVQILRAPHLHPSQALVMSLEWVSSLACTPARLLHFLSCCIVVELTT